MTSTAAVGARVSLSPVTVPLGAEAAGGGEIEVLPIASANVASKRKKTTAAVSSSAAVKKEHPVDLYKYPTYTLTNVAKKDDGHEAGRVV